MVSPNFSHQNNSIRICLGSALFLAASIIATFVFGTLVLLGIIFPFNIRYRIGKGWAETVLKLAEIFCGVRYEVEGLEHININSGAIVLSNHQSAWETLAFRCFLPPQTSLFKQSLLWIPIWGWAMATLKPIAIDRDSKHSALRKLISRGTEALKEGLWVIVFPEGTRMSADKLGDFSAGGAMLAQKSGYPVVPIAHNAGLFWPRYSFIKYPGTIKVKIGPYVESKGRKAADINKEAEDWVKNAMQEINP
ncbi:1-acyl-sn-glycerol-3-phosphate acyltransferase [Methyloglobulus morosus KoM1]|uniref:1-acyl-sn-glycerol-3-phosphate acyltransferase n=1 Tax=Methyloglobulus morosus KoM1 TaxID=1116472 RepID=V5BL69_9GAMM|nr:1-acyl-sn-glycerol-3-phosphate acyltransferase [Methyloglobulus morosus KoM1]